MIHWIKTNTPSADVVMASSTISDSDRAPFGYRDIARTNGANFSYFDAYGMMSISNIGVGNLTDTHWTKTDILLFIRPRRPKPLKWRLTLLPLLPD